MISFIITDEEIPDLMGLYKTNYTDLKSGKLDQQIIKNGVLRCLVDMYHRRNEFFDNYSVYKYLFECKHLLKYNLKIHKVFTKHYDFDIDLLEVCRILEIEKNISFLPDTEKEYLETANRR